MLRYGRFRVLLDTVPEGVMVTIHDHEGFVCEVVAHDAQTAVIAALDAAIASDGEDPDGCDQLN
jgi:antitoxin (DNA-binding transcriptional repressor) of toxin-antitoxin stability system